jgi:molybdopterin-guanine dinucleotide biosynthesis protein A
MRSRSARRDVIPTPLVGIFVGDRSVRMGGAPEGLLRPPDGEGSRLAHVVGLARSRGFGAVLVGAHPAYERLGVEMIADAASDVGPIGGLTALLERAGGRASIALACDLAFVDASLLARLVDEVPDAPVLAPRRDGRWEPLAARCDAARATDTARRWLAAGALGLQGLLDEVGAHVMDLSDPSALDDWDGAEDLRLRTR